MKGTHKWIVVPLFSGLTDWPDVNPRQDAPVIAALPVRRSLDTLPHRSGLPARGRAAWGGYRHTSCATSTILRNLLT